MNPATYIVFALLALLAIYQIYVSIAIVGAEEYEQAQRLLQLVLVWIFSLFGAVACHMVLQGLRGKVRRREAFFVPQEPNDGGRAGHSWGGQ